MSGIWFVKCISVIGDVITLCSPGNNCKQSSTDFWAFQSRAKICFEKQQKKSQSLAAINTWKSRKIAHKSHQVWIYSVFLKYVFLSQFGIYRDAERWFLQSRYDSVPCSLAWRIPSWGRNKFQRNPATQTKESLLLLRKLGQTAFVLLLKDWLTLGTAEVQRLCRHLAIVPWLGISFLPFKVSYKLQLQIWNSSLKKTLDTNI